MLSSADVYKGMGLLPPNYLSTLKQNTPFQWCQSCTLLTGVTGVSVSTPQLPTGKNVPAKRKLARGGVYLKKPNKKNHVRASQTQSCLTSDGNVNLI